MKKLKNMGLARKFSVTMLFSLILPLVFLFSIMNSVIAREFMEKQYEKELEVLKQSKPSLENVLEDTQTLSRNIVGNKEIQALLEAYEKSGVVNEETLSRAKVYIEEMIYTKRYISSMSLFTKGKTLYQYGGYYKSEDIFELPELEKELGELDGKPMWDSARMHGGYMAGKGNWPVVSVYRIINHLYRLTPVGAERISISEEYLCSLYASAEPSEEEQAYIFDEDGRIVSAREKELLTENVSKEIIDRAIGQDGYFVEEKHGQAVFYYKVPITGWTVVRTKSMSVLQEQIHMINNIIWMCLTLAIFFGFVFSIVQKRSVIDPVVRLAKDVEKVDEGNYAIKLHTGNQDEIGMLNQSVIQMTSRIRDLIETVYKGQIHMREAEILSLQAQINPHFLYNTLDTMRWIAIDHEEDLLACQIEALSSMFRHVLNNGKEVTTVEEEVAHLKNYLAVQHCRFGEKIQVEMNVDEQLYSCRVLKLILQPLVENSFVHGLEEKIGGGKIAVSVTGEQGAIVYQVTDNGVGVDAVKIQEILRTEGQTGKIYALKNVNDRIKLKYGEAYGVTFQSEVGEGTEVVVRIPRALMEV